MLVVQALAQRIQQASTLADVVKLVQSLLDGTAEGKLRGIHERSGLAGALAHLASTEHASSDLASQVCLSACGIYRCAVSRPVLPAHSVAPNNAAEEWQSSWHASRQKLPQRELCWNVSLDQIQMTLMLPS